MIQIKEYQNDTTFVADMQQEVFEFGSNSALDSGLFDTVVEAQNFANEIVTEAFKSNPDKQHCFAIQADNNIVGCIWLRDYRNPESPGEARLSYIRIDPLHQRKGIAVKAIYLLEEYAMRNGYTEMSLNVFANLPHAKKLYECIGFKVMHETERGGKVVTTEMRKILSNQTIQFTNTWLPK